MTPQLLPTLLQQTTIACQQEDFKHQKIKRQNDDNRGTAWAEAVSMTCFVVAFTVVSSLNFRHERSDSTGTTGEAIAKPVRKSHPSRIVLVCDVIESWTSSLPARGSRESVAQ
ncbi:hypothetical protein TNCV_4713711 [Trichonephila clavipes]|nr:hypothetical protein TNCV_4713711 [Trichonephila clavipes]